MIGLLAGGLCVVAELSKRELGEQPNGTLLQVAGQGGPDGCVDADGVGKRWRMSHGAPSRQRYDKPGQWHPSRVLRGAAGGPGVAVCLARAPAGRLGEHRAWECRAVKRSWVLRAPPVTCLCH